MNSVITRGSDLLPFFFFPRRPAGSSGRARGHNTVEIPCPPPLTLLRRSVKRAGDGKSSRSRQVAKAVLSSQGTECQLQSGREGDTLSDGFQYGIGIHASDHMVVIITARIR